MQNYEEAIISDPKIMTGKPVIKGTNITVEQIIEQLAEGRSIEAILEAHPDLTHEQLQAAFAYAAHTLRTLEVSQEAPAPTTNKAHSVAGAASDLLWDDEFEALDRIRHASRPTPLHTII